jgi:chemotaxis protein methyltransferase CheR
MDYPAITEKEFNQIRSLIYDIAGISMSPVKKPLVVGRLNKRLRHYQFSNFNQYYDYVTNKVNGAELQVMVDLLTTNETYFYREPKHFEFLSEVVLPETNKGIEFKVWSAASSSGEEPYTLAMTLADHFGIQGNWNILATDISSRVLERARQGVYNISEAEKIPKDILRKYCLKGVRSHEGSLIIDDKLKRKISFEQFNLNSEQWQGRGEFDVIFLRNVMIYFDQETKRKLVANLANHLKPNGYFVIGHSETLNAVSDRFNPIRPSIYRRKD